MCLVVWKLHTWQASHQAFSLKHPPPPPSAVLCRSWGLILYRSWVPASALDQEAELDLGAPAHDYASVLVDGELAGRMNRSRPGTSLTLPARRAGKCMEWLVGLAALLLPAQITEMHPLLALT